MAKIENYMFLPQLEFQQITQFLISACTNDDGYRAAATNRKGSGRNRLQNLQPLLQLPTPLCCGIVKAARDSKQWTEHECGTKKTLPQRQTAGLRPKVPDPCKDINIYLRDELINIKGSSVRESYD